MASGNSLSPFSSSPGPEQNMNNSELKSEAEAIPKPDIVSHGELVSASMPNFFQIRNRFEERSKREMKHKDSPVVGIKEQEQQDPLIFTSPKSELEPEFQKLYPFFKEYFSKRQFASMENCFKEADKNGDGFLEAKEVKQLLAEHNHKVNLCDADSIINVGDQDQDGKLSPKEFLELCKSTAENIRQQQHMEGSYPPSDREFIEIIVQKLIGFVNPVSNPKVKGTKQFFENIISAGTRTKAIPGKGTHLPLPLRRRLTEKGSSLKNLEEVSHRPQTPDPK